MVKYQLHQDKKPNGLIIKLFVADGEYIVGNLNELYQFRILGDPKSEGTNYVYKVELGGGNMNGVPDAIKMKHICHCMQADPAYGQGVAKALGIELPK